MEKKKTAVDYAVEKLEKFIPSGNQIAIDVILEKAKEMEKQQIIDACKYGFQIDAESDTWDSDNTQALEYYNETFKQD